MCVRSMTPVWNITIPLSEFKKLDNSSQKKNNNQIKDYQSECVDEIQTFPIGFDKLRYESGVGLSVERR